MTKILILNSYIKTEKEKYLFLFSNIHKHKSFSLLCSHLDCHSHSSVQCVLSPHFNYYLFPGVLLDLVIPKYLSEKQEANNDKSPLKKFKPHTELVTAA